ncbi:MAG: hypothetical protein K9I82_02395 [Chitinophagaceae bacterium]|nr:hypothetical protein [Chitinophagaceae bacterium]
MESKINTIVNIILKLVIIGCFIFVPYWFMKKPDKNNKIDDATSRKIIELEKSNKRIEDNQIIIQDKIDKYFKQIDDVSKNIDQINKQKQLARKYYYEKIIAIDTFDWDAIDSFFTKRYRFDTNK